MPTLPFCLQRLGWWPLFEFTTRKHTATLGVGIFFALLAGLVTPIFSVLLGEIFNSFTIFGGGEISAQVLIHQVSISCLKLLSLGIAGWACSTAYFTLFVAFGELQAANARSKLFEGLLGRDQQWFETQRDGTRTFLSSLQVQLQDLQMATAQPLGLVLQYSFRAAGALGLAFYTSWNLSLVILAGIPIFSTIISYLSSKTGTSIETQTAELTRASKVVNNAVANIDAVMCHNAQDLEFRNFVSRIDQAMSHYLQQACLSSLQIAISRFMMFSMFVQGFWYGSILVKSGRLSSGEVLRTFWACSTAAQSVELLLPHASVLEKGKLAVFALKRVLRDRVDEASTKEMQGSLYPRYCEGDIEVSNLSFFYSSQPERLVLNSSSFFFPAGTTTFVIGESGSGKSTLGQLLARLYLPTSGEILIDGLPIQTLSTNWTRNNITLVEQRSILFNESILKNIAFGRRDYETIRKRDVRECIDLAMLQNTLDNLPNGIETSVGDGGDFLSGGQKQRVAIARARLRNTPILILDEPTSALDGQNCTAVMKAIREWREGKTTIIITHDMSHIGDNDFVYILNNGSVARAGYNFELKVRPMTQRTPHIDNEDRLFNRTTNSEYDDEFVAKDLFSDASSINSLEDSDYASADEFSKTHHVKYPKPSYSPRDYTYTRRGDLFTLEGWRGRQRGRSSGFVKSSPTSRDEIPMNDIKTWSKKATGLPSAHQHPPLRRAIQTLLPSLTSKQRFLLLLATFCTLGHSSATPLFSYFLSRLLGTFYDEGSDSVKWALAVLGVAVCDAFVSFFMHYLLDLCGEAWVGSLRKRAFRRILHQDRSWYSETRNSSSQLSACLHEAGEEVRNLVGRFGSFILIAASVTLLAVTWSLVVCWNLTFVALACGPVIYTITRGFEKTSGVWDRRCQDGRITISSVFMDTFSEIRTVRILTLESYFHQKLLKAASRCMTTGLKRAMYTGFLFGLVECTIIFVSDEALIFYYGATLVSYSQSSVQNVMTVFSILLFGIGYATSVMSFIPQISTAREMASQLLRLVDLPEYASHEHRGNHIIPRVADIRLSGLTFRYPSRPDTVVLRDVFINIPEGSCTALVGPSGSGKSTIASLLLSLYEAPPSSIFLGNTDIRSLHKPSLRSLVAIVSQLPSIFPGTIYANIAYGLETGSPLNSLRNVHGAAKSADIHDFIVSLPKGYYTLIGDGGVGLSGGQAQRLMIARALVRQPQVLILDEATSSLDPGSAKRIKQTVQRLITAQIGLTVLIITHASEMMQIADNIIVLDQGCVVEEGPYNALLSRKNGRFQALVMQGDAKNF